MIFDAIINFATTLLTIFVGFFPLANQQIISQVNGQMSLFKTIVAQASPFVDIQTFFQLVSYIFIIELSVLTFRSIRWLSSIISGGIIK